MQPFTFFISYRRQDTAPIALLLKNEIEKRLTFVRVSVDVEEMQPGDEFPERIQRLIGQAHATLALIGRHWMPRSEEDAILRKEDDWIVRELEYSVAAPVPVPESDHPEITKRLILPLFADCDRDFRQFRLPTALAFMAQLHGERIDYAGWPVQIGPLLDRIAVKLALKKRPDADEYPTPNPVKARTQPLADGELRTILAYDDYDGWYVDNFGNAEVRYLVKTFEFPHFNRPRISWLACPTTAACWGTIRSGVMFSIMSRCR